MIREIAGYCTSCKSRCGVVYTVDGNRLARVDPLPTHPTGLAICAKGRAAPEIAHSSRRLTQPLRRTNAKGGADPGWKAISWDEALDEISDQLKRLRDDHGAESVAFALTSPSATPIVDGVEWIERFIALYGSPNVCNATEICNWTKDVAHAFTFGCPLPQPDWKNADLLLLWGHNPASVWLAEAGEIAEAVRRGARLAVIDPRRTTHARDAAHWLAVKPGTDAALALGLANLLLKAGRFDDRFVRRFTNAPFLVRDDNGRFLRGRDLDDGVSNDDSYVVFDAAIGAIRRCGARPSPPSDVWENVALSGAFVLSGISCRPAFDLFRRRCAEYPVERVTAITGVAASQVTALAEAIGQARSVCHTQWTGLGQHAGATQTSRAVATLYALTGHFDASGGNVVAAAHAAAPISDPSLLPAAQRAKALGALARPLGPAAMGMVTSRELYDAILDHKPYRVRALVTFGANLLLSRADVAQGLRALRTLEFQVHCDLFETPTAREADILLPVGGPWEREALKIGFEVNHEAQELIQLRPALLPRFAESRSDAEIVCALAQRLGFAEQMFDADIEAGWRHRLAPLAISLDELRKHPEGVRLPLSRAYRKYADPIPGDNGVRGFATETGHVEIYSELLLRHGQDPLPDPGQAQSLQRTSPDYPVLLTSAKNPYFCHSQHRGVASLRRRAREPIIAIAPTLAQRHDIVEGDWTVVRTCTGQARFRAKIDEALLDHVAVVDFGWWQATPELGLEGYNPLDRNGSNFNLLIDSDTVDPVSGAAPLKSFACRIERARDPAPLRWSGQRQLKIVGRRLEAGQVAVLDLAATDGTDLPPFRPGQHITVTARLPTGKMVSRSYSLCGPTKTHGADRYRIAVKRIAPSPACGDGGLFSAQVMPLLRVGGQLEANAPSGSFVIPSVADFPVVLVGAGIGVTPFLGYLEALRNVPNPPEVWFHYATRNSASHAFHARITELAADLPSAKIITYYSRPTAEDRTRSAFQVEGRILADSFPSSILAQRPRFYLCGPNDMMAELRAELIARGVAPFEIFSEQFVPPADHIASRMVSDQRFSVTFARSGRITTWSIDKGNLLAFAETEGIALPSGCRVGQCESCALNVLSGTVSHLTTIAEIEPGTCLACQAVPASDLVIDA